jgi:hypothetical protein
MHKKVKDSKIGISKEKGVKKIYTLILCVCVKYSFPSDITITVYLCGYSFVLYSHRLK